jgi:hypothetical protein
MFDNPALWVSVASLVVAFLSAAFSYWNARTASRRLRLDESIAMSRKPRLTPYFGEGYCKKLRNLSKWAYVFRILINNPTDISNSISRIELQIGYTTPSHDYMSVKLPHVNRNSDDVLTDKSDALILPATIPAHGTIAGSVVFYLDEQLVSRWRIDDFRILITDAHEEIAVLEPVIIRDLIDEEEVDNTKSRDKVSI